MTGTAAACRWIASAICLGNAGQGLIAATSARQFCPLIRRWRLRCWQKGQGRISRLARYVAAIGAITGALGVSLGPLLAIIAAVAALVAAFVHLWKTNDEFKSNIIAIWEQIKSTFTGLTQGITDRLNALGFDFESFMKNFFLI